MTFTETSDIETGFAPVYDTRIKPELDRLETLRLDLKQRGRRAVWLGVGLGLVAAAAALLLVEDTVGGLIIAAGLVGVGAVLGFAFGHQGNRWSNKVAEVIMPVICDFVGDLRYDRTASDGFPVAHMKTLGLFGKYDRARLEDHISGTWQGIGFDLVEANLSRETSDHDGDTREESVFRGLLFRIDLPARAPTPILVARNYGALINSLSGLFAGGNGRGMPRVETGHAAFEAEFELHAEDADAARAYLPPPFLDVLLEIGETEAKDGAAGMRAGFVGNSFWMAISRTRPFLEIASLSRPVYEIETQLHEVFAELAMIRSIIDRLRA